MNLIDLFTEIEDERLSRAQLEAYEQKLASLKGRYQLRKAELLKAKGLFKKRLGDVPNTKKEDEWDSSDEGQELIDVKGNIDAISPILSSIKSRIYQSY